MAADRRPDQSCCTPARPGAREGRLVSAIEAGAAGGQVRTRDGHGLVRLPGGDFRMGSEDADAVPGDGEGPVRIVHVEPFMIDAAPVTNARFRAFVEATGYVTQAERFGDSYVFVGLLSGDHPPTWAVAAAPWWRQVPGADWRHPEGRGSSLDGRLDHPVVHVSWADASAYAAHVDARLPTEAEWEYAARGGLDGARFAWGDELEPGGEHRCNIWQGEFPARNTRADGFLGTSPVGAFPPNAWGLYDVAGNVWEWCADWWRVGSFHPADPRHDARGPATGTERVTRGGSYLCHASYCNRYRVAARNRSTPDSSTGNLGFRCARDA